MTKSCVGCFVAGAAAAAALAVALVFAWTRHLEVTTASTVHGPLLSALSDLGAAAAESGKQDLLACRIGQLKRHWQAYAFASGESPELFVPRLRANEFAGCS